MRRPLFPFLIPKETSRWRVETPRAVASRNAATVSPRHVAAHVCVCVCVGVRVVTSGKRGTVARRTIQGGKRQRRGEHPDL